MPWRRSRVSAAVRADLVESSWLVAGRADGTGAHGMSVAEPLHLFHAFAKHTEYLTINETCRSR